MPRTPAAPAPSSAPDALLRDLARLDARLARAVAAARERADGGDGAGDPYRGLYVSPGEAESLLERGPGTASLPFPGGDAPAADEGSPLGRLARRAGLDALDAELLLVAVAADLDLRYERIFAFLQDDVTRRRPTADLALSLLCPTFAARAEGRRRLAPSAPLRQRGLLHLADDGTQKHPPLLARTLKADERVVDHLLGIEETDDTLVPAVRAATPGTRLADLVLPEDLKRRLAILAAEGAAGRGAAFHLRGAYGVGKAATAGALCVELGMPLLEVDVAALLAGDAAGWDERVRRVLREAMLRGAAVLWEGWDALSADERRPQRVTLLREAEGWGGLLFFAGAEGWDPADTLDGLPFYRVELERPGHDGRARLWRASLNGAAEAPGVDPEALANKFRFSGGQIRDAAATARDLARTRDPEGGRVTMADLHAACRLHSNPRLAALARKVTPRYAWGDIVLPPDRVQQLREIVNHMKYRSLVFGEWGFDGKLAMGKGLNALFAGPSGTGKTMAAEIVAGELGLDLYKVDLSTVVSKYIGETEKNLGRIFTEAETSNAILFFDEADSLFGKRSEVRDSHDRYANLETSYLLQKMEEYEGVVILATNFRKNLDDAFVRRLHFTVDFPFPGERERLRIWQGVWPERAPRGPDLSLEFVARRVEVAGGNIRNIALAAAFLAADDGGVVTMAHLVRATRREYQKMGKVLSEAELGELGRLG